MAYPYAFAKDDYRRPFRSAGNSFGIEFHFADQRITNKHILDKITDMMTSSRFSLFDVTRWNANVTLELGFALGRGCDFYLLFNPDDALNPKAGEVPADLGGLDRIQYHSYDELEERLGQLLTQEFGPPPSVVSEAPYMGHEPGLTPVERLLLQRLSQGLRGRALAESLPRSAGSGLPLSDRQIARYAASARSKLGAKTGEEAVAEAIRQHLI